MPSKNDLKNELCGGFSDLVTNHNYVLESGDAIVFYDREHASMKVHAGHAPRFLVQNFMAIRKNRLPVFENNMFKSPGLDPFNARLQAVHCLATRLFIESSTSYSSIRHLDTEEQKKCKKAIKVNKSKQRRNIRYHKRAA
eukprot:Platyproteum_vivax@DN3557_c0_g1_i2.p1